MPAPSAVPLPAILRVPGAGYCANADCTDGRPDRRRRPAAPVVSTATLGRHARAGRACSGQNSFIEFGKKPFAADENGGINGHVIYASTRPFDDPSLLAAAELGARRAARQINLYQEGASTRSATSTLTLVDTTTTSSWDDWAQGFPACRRRSRT